MERDFMGLKSKDSLVVVKEEITENPQDSVCHHGCFLKGNKCFLKGTSWAYMSKMSAVPHFVSFRGGQQQHDRMTKMEAYEQSQKADLQNMQRAYDMKISVSSQSLPPSTSNTSLQPGFASCGQNSVGSTLRQQLLSAPLTVPFSNSPPIVGVTEPGRNNSKTCAGPAQMTIFYAGTVSVYDDLSPEKAQAIMLLAGNNSSFTNVAHSRPPAHTPTPKLVTSDAMTANQPLNSQPAPSLSSPRVVTSRSVIQPVSDSKNCDKLSATRTTGMSTTPTSKPESQNVFGSVSALPQARRASLLRFLEKRKERLLQEELEQGSSKKPREEAAPRNDASQSASSAANS